MRRKEFIDIILNSISDKFDIYHNYYLMAENLLFMHIATITTIVLRHQAMNQNFGIPAVLSICFL